MPRHLSIKDFSYHLPEEKIAKEPLEKRDESKLLVFKNETISEGIFKDLTNHLPANSLLVFNNTKVICARLIFEIEGKTKPIEIFLLEPASSREMQSAMVQKGKAKWKCLVGNNKGFKADYIEKKISYEGKEYFIKVFKPEASGDVFEVEIEWNEEVFFAEILNFAGLIPLPPYLKREVTESDKDRYQTVYAKQEGSVAAPTAGLHFTENVLDNLEKEGHKCEFVQLHVGAGTFKPVKAEQMEGHEMHSEEIVVSKLFIEKLIAQQENIIAVGTTSLRTLETLYWVGAKLKYQKLEMLDNVLVNQWDAYDLKIESDFTFVDALNEIKQYLEKNKLENLVGKTQILIAPGYEIKSSVAIITNFHQPDSTLLLLIAAMVGEKWREIYAYALENNFRFLSFGDSSILFRNQSGNKP